MLKVLRVLYKGWVIADLHSLSNSDIVLPFIWETYGIWNITLFAVKLCTIIFLGPTGEPTPVQFKQERCFNATNVLIKLSPNVPLFIDKKGNVYIY